MKQFNKYDGLMFSAYIGGHRVGNIRQDGDTVTLYFIYKEVPCFAKIHKNRFEQSLNNTILGSYWIQINELAAIDIRVISNFKLISNLYELYE